MDIKKSQVLIISLATLIGLIISVHTSDGRSDHNVVSLNSVDSLRGEINTIEREIEKNLDRIEQRKDYLGRLETLSNQDEDVKIASMLEELEDLEIHSGFKELEGPGIELRIADNTSDGVVGDNINDDIIHDSDIQIIINDLKRAGAEAISINGQRVTSRSEVKCGGPVIKINQRSSANPFVINAIGDPALLYAAIESQGSYGKMLRDVYKIEVRTDIVEELRVPGYHIDSIDYRYIDMEKEG